MKRKFKQCFFSLLLLFFNGLCFATPAKDIIESLNPREGVLDLSGHFILDGEPGEHFKETQDKIPDSSGVYYSRPFEQLYFCHLQDGKRKCPAFLCDLSDMLSLRKQVDKKLESALLEVTSLLMPGAEAVASSHVRRLQSVFDFAAQNLPNLEKLDLSGNHISDLHGVDFSDHATFKTLKELNLSGNYLSEDSLCSFIPLLKRENFEQLVIHGNAGIDENAVELLFQKISVKCEDIDEEIDDSEDLARKYMSKVIWMAEHDVEANPRSLEVWGQLEAHRKYFFKGSEIPPGNSKEWLSCSLLQLVDQCEKGCSDSCSCPLCQALESLKREKTQQGIPSWNASRLAKRFEVEIVSCKNSGVAEKNLLERAMNIAAEGYLWGNLLCRNYKKAQLWLHWVANMYNDPRVGNGSECTRAIYFLYDLYDRNCLAIEETEANKQACFWGQLLEQKQKFLPSWLHSNRHH